MEYDELIIILKELSLPSSGFNMILIDGFYWGRGSAGEFLFGFDTREVNILPVNQSTKYLKLFLNCTFKITVNQEVANKNVSLLILKNNEDKLVELFVKLSLMLSKDTDEYVLLNHFLSLKDLFSNEKKTSSIELQGLYGELYAMYYLKSHLNRDISIFYQQVDKNKFDYSINQTKKIEIKSTLKPVRIHHFLHQQLDTDRCDIVVFSIMFQKDDCGLSLHELINKCKVLFSTNINLIFHIENMIKNIDISELDEIKYNTNFLNDKIKFYHANDIPKVNSKNIEGVFNIEYDIDLSNTKEMNKEKFLCWLDE